MTELKQRFNPHTAGESLQFSFDSRPGAVIAKEGLTSAEKGTLLHLILNKVDLTAQIDAVYLEGLLKELETEKFIAAGAADGLPLQGVDKVFPVSMRSRKGATSCSSRSWSMTVPVGTYCTCHRGSLSSMGSSQSK